MEEVIFPAINLKLNINPVAFNLFGVNVNWYALIIVSAFAIGILLCKKNDGKYNIKFEDILTLFIFLIPISIICARLYYIIFKLEYYINNPSYIFNIRNGGLAIYGGIIGAIITIFVFCKKKKINFYNILDFLAPYLALGQSIGRWGNFFNREAHGIETNSIFRMGIVEKGQYIEVHPTFLYESVCNLMIFIILIKISNKRKYKGQITCLYLALYSFIRAIIEGLRTDSLMLGNLRISQALSILLFIISTTILIYMKIKNNKTNNKNKGEEKI